MLKSPWRLVQARRKAHDLISGRTLSASQIFLNYLVDEQGADVVWPLVNISSGNVVLANNSVYNGPAAGLVGWQLQNVDGPIAGTKAPLSDGVNDYGVHYSAAFDALFNGGLFSTAIMFRAYTGSWTNGVNNFAMRIGVDSNNQIIFFQPNNVNQFRFRVVGNGTNKQVQYIMSDYNWHFAWITYNVAADRMRVGIDESQIGSDLSGIDTVSGIDSGNTVIGAASDIPTAIWHGWLAYAMFWASEKSVADMGAIASFIV